MRVIAGAAKGTTLTHALPKGTRPVTDRAREGLFSSLASEVEGAAVLDLFAGSGALGIEALSRGAATATFVESDHAAVRAIHGNLERTRSVERARVVRRDAIRYLDGLSEPASLVFCDPPYAIEPRDLERVLSLLHTGGWLDPAGWTVALTRPSKGYTPVTPINWVAARTLRYGDTHIILYREV